MDVGAEPNESPVVSLINFNKNKLKEERKEMNAKMIIDSICLLVIGVV